MNWRQYRLELAPPKTGARNNDSPAREGLQVGRIGLKFFANREAALYLPLQVSLPYFMLQDATEGQFGEAAPQRWFEMREVALGRLSDAAPTKTGPQCMGLLCAGSEQL